jgi:hypothetical protein
LGLCTIYIHRTVSILPHSSRALIQYLSDDVIATHAGKNTDRNITGNLHVKYFNEGLHFNHESFAIQGLLQTSRQHVFHFFKQYMYIYIYIYIKTEREQPLWPHSISIPVFPHTQRLTRYSTNLHWRVERQF